MNQSSDKADGDKTKPGSGTAGAWKTALPCGDVLGAPVTVGNLESMCGEILQAALEEKQGYVCVANVHMVTEARRNFSLLGIMRGASAVTSDGMPLVWALRMSGHRRACRVAGPDLAEALCISASRKGVPVYFYGGMPEAAGKLQDVLKERFPNLDVRGCESPPMLPARPDLDESVVRRIHDSEARLVFVGLGCPKQEFWMAAHSGSIHAVLLGVGAAFDFLAGTRRRAPRWMQRIGLEWLHRLVSEPGRLWKRYLWGNLRFLGYLLHDLPGKI